MHSMESRSNTFSRSVGHLKHSALALHSPAHVEQPKTDQPFLIPSSGFSSQSLVIVFRENVDIEHSVHSYAVLHFEHP